MKAQIFIATVLLESILGVSLILTLFVPGFRAWPPPGKNSWQYYFVWVSTISSYIGLIALGILDWNSFKIHHRIRFPVGILILIIGLALTIWGVRALGIHASQGLGGDLIRVGPYQFTRNPQYVGDVAMIIGYIILSSSKMLLIAGLLGVIWFILAPYVEELWLRGQFGEDYDDYALNVPRFIIPKRRKDAG